MRGEGIGEKEERGNIGWNIKIKKQTHKPKRFLSLNRWSPIKLLHLGLREHYGMGQNFVRDRGTQSFCEIVAPRNNKETVLMEP